MLGLGLVLWFAKDVSDVSIQKGLGIALLVSAVTGLVVTLLGTFASHAVIRTNGWAVMLVYLVFGAGYGYLLFLKRESSLRPA
jgi:FtsH-binding integral membrane protein